MTNQEVDRPYYSICLYLHNGNTKLSNRTKTVQTFVLELHSLP